MIQDPYLAEVYPFPPLAAYKRQPNIQDAMIRAKVPDQVASFWHEKMPEVPFLPNLFNLATV